MKDALVYPREHTLGAITLVLGLLAWLLLIVGTIGIVLIYLLFIFLFYLFAQSALISWLRGNGVLLSAAQLPDLRARFDACCDKLGMTEKPEAYLLQGGGVLNAFAARFIGRHYIVLLSDIVDAMDEHPDGINFYFGHELGHVRMKHLTGFLWRAPVLWLPLLGAAYSRAREYTCDRHGRACCETPESAARALVALAAGSERWKQVDLGAYAEQAVLSRGFWMSYHELTGGYPWLTKRTLRVLDPEAKAPARSGFAYLLAAFVPYAGRAGGAAALLVLVAIIGILAAFALPAYNDYQARLRLIGAYQGSTPARQALAAHFEEKQEPPESLAALNIVPKLPDGSELSLDADDMTLTVATGKGDLVFSPRVRDGKVFWICSGGDGVKPGQLPRACRTGSPVVDFGADAPASEPER